MLAPHLLNSKHAFVLALLCVPPFSTTTRSKGGLVNTRDITIFRTNKIKREDSHERKKKGTDSEVARELANESAKA